MTRSTIDSQPRPLGKSLEEYGRGVVGGLMFSLPLLYTMEVWWSGFLAQPLHLIAYVAATVFLLLGYNRFAGMRRDASWTEVVIDSVEEMGIGLILSTVVLYLLGQIERSMPWPEVLGKIVVESMTVAIGVSIGTAQLGLSTDDTGVEDDDRERDQKKSTEPPDSKSQLVLALCGAVLFAGNVGPTEEIIIIAAMSSAGKLLGLAALSILSGALVLFRIGFVGTDRHVRRDNMIWVGYGLITSYAAALIASALLLCFFGRLDDVPPAVAIARIVVLSFPAMLGASAGRLLIQ